MSEVSYVLGHTPREIERLQRQAELLRPLTLQMLAACSLAPGNTVLDIGTGAGDVAMLAAGMVGPSGTVVGIDRNADVLARARLRAEAAGLDQLRFEQMHLDEADALGTFDAVVGRYVLVHQADRVGFLRAAAALVKNGGHLALLELATSADESFAFPPLEVYAAIMAQIHEAFQAAGSELGVGTRLVELFATAGLPEPQLMAATPVGGPASAVPAWLVETWSSLLPALIAGGGTPAVEPAEALDRLLAAATAAKVQLFGPRNVVGWAKLGSPADG